MGKNVIISTLPNISQNYLPKVNTSNIFANSLVYDNGTNVMVNTTTANTDYTGARLVVSNTSNSYLEVRSTAGQSSIVLTTATSTTSNFPTVEIFNSADFGIVAYRPGVVSSNYLMYYELSSSTNRRLTFQTEGVTRLGIQGAGRILMGPTLPTDDGSTALQVNGGGKFSSSVTAATNLFVGGTTDPYSLGRAVIIHDSSRTRTYFVRDVNMIEIIPSNGTDPNRIHSTYTSGGSAYKPLSLSARQTDTDLYLTTGGNVGIGTNSPDVTGFGYTTLTIKGGTTAGYAGVLELQTTQTTSNGQNIGIMAFLDGTSRNAQIGVQRDSSTSTANMMFYTNAGAGIVERMRITSGGATIMYNNMAVVDGQEIYDTQAYAANTGGTINFGGKYNSAGAYTIYGRVSGRKENSTDGNTAGYLLFTTKENGGGSTERMRITSGGYLKASNNGTYLGSTGNYHEFGNSVSDQNTIAIVSNASSPYGMYLRFTAAAPSNTTNYYLYGDDTGNSRFIIYSNGNMVNRNGSYGTISSDIRLKENIISATSKLNDLMKLNVVNFNFIGSQEKHIGFIAQEMEKVFPSFVFKTDTRVYDDNGNLVSGLEDSLGIKVGMEFAILVKAIQEQQAQIEEQKADIESLKALINK